jgi:phosphomannomutase
MVQEELFKLQNGSDIRGIAVEINKGNKVNLTYDVVYCIASAFALWLSNKKNIDTKKLKISIGMDSRISGPRIKKAAIEGMINRGVSVFDFNLASTPSMFMSTITKGYEYDGAIMVTASHLPFDRNGLKFFTNQGGLEPKDIKDILNIASCKDEHKADKKGSITEVDFMSLYSKILVDKIRNEVNKSQNYNEPLKGFKIVVDAGNGVGGFFVDKVLKPLGADTSGSQFLEPDGYFPNHIPNPENKDAIDSISRAVVENNADFGIIFDTDVDRAGAVASNGEEINRNRLIALVSSIVLEEHPNSIIVTDSVTSTGLKYFIENELKGIHHRFKRGYKNVINEAIRLNEEGKESYLAMETSGHGALKENYFLDDGAYLITKILIKMAKLKNEEDKTIETLIENLKEPAESIEFRMKIGCEDFKGYGESIIKNIKDFAANKDGWVIAPDNYEGIRVYFDKNNGDGWFLLRMSLHEPLMPLNIESDSNGGVKIIASNIFEFLKAYDKLDVGSIYEFIK